MAQYQPVCSSDAIAEQDAKGFLLDGQPVIVARRDNQVYAYKNNCPHWGVELNVMPDQFMDLDQQFIICANHGALFELETGNCLSGPCSGQSLEPVPCREELGQVMVAVPEPAAADA